MKKILMIIALAGVTSVFAQENKNEKKETVVTKTKVTDNMGTDVATKSVTKTEKQVIALQSGDENKTNQEIVMLPANVNTEVDYSNEGINYTFEQDDRGYRMITGNGTDDINDYAILRPSTQKGYYIISQDGNNSFGYFDNDGNFVLESYNAVDDTVTSTVYQLEMKERKIMKKDKM
ncbi:hypothetical protein [Ulvibacter antarcticus]|uniref:WG repeat protein n=1 Tax=Ulvibacter antarcticus TaxID=442714 RepID=A0A3L9ZCW4_9FLAO|nr:hypothetical protein [Ulvibacter antarcticus]RMA64492.1 hypothetical protein BXY75_1368 [Ulvibacter antarcticus]